MTFSVRDTMSVTGKGSVSPRAIRLNEVGKWTVVAATLVFNVTFWAVAMIEYFRTAEEYMDSEQG